MHGATTSDRPPVYVAELVSGGFELPLTRYGSLIVLCGSSSVFSHFSFPGETWRIMRKAAHDMISKEACNRHLPIQRAEASQLMFDLVGSPQVRVT